MHLSPLPALLIALLALPWATGSAQDSPEARIQALEARLERLAERVEVLEGQAGAAGAGTRTGKDLVWTFDEGLTGSPFRVIQQELDRRTGQVDLLLTLVAEPPDADLWRAAQVGALVPLAVTATLSGGATLGPIPLTLHRRSAFTPGVQVHVMAQLPGLDAKAVRRIAVGQVRTR